MDLLCFQKNLLENACKSWLDNACKSWTLDLYKDIGKAFPLVADPDHLVPVVADSDLLTTCSS